MQAISVCVLLCIFFALTIVNVSAFEKKPIFPEQVEIPSYNGKTVEMRKVEGLNYMKNVKANESSEDGGDDGGDDDGSSKFRFLKSVFHNNICYLVWTNKWLWIGLGIILVVILVLIGLLVVKQCFCERKRKMKYNKLDIENTYGSHAPVTEKHRADMEAKYGKLSSDY